MNSLPTFCPQPAAWDRPRGARTPRSTSAFTLLEVLVASAILGIVMAILLSTLTTSISLWRTTEASQGAGREGRAAELLIAQDLANAVVPSNSAFWPQATTDTLRFLTVRTPDYQSGAGNIGDVCFVEYKVADDADNANANFLALTRAFVGSAETYAALKGGALPAVSETNRQLLAANIVPNKRVVYVNPGAVSEVTADYFTALGRNGLPLKNPKDLPALIDINLSMADETSVENLDVANKQLRTAGYFPFRVALPRPQ